MGERKNILVLDTAMSGCGAAFLSGDDCVSKAEHMPRGQSERLIPLVCEVLEEAGAAFSDVDALVTTLGPGAFTGLRIGLSAARAFSVSLNKPLMGISSLQAVALTASEENEFDGGLRVIIDPRRDDYFMQDFDSRGVPQGDPKIVDAKAVLNLRDGIGCIAGDAVNRLEADMLKEGLEINERAALEPIVFPDPEIIARSFLMRADLFDERCEPLYMRGADVSVSKKIYRSLQ